MAVSSERGGSKKSLKGPRHSGASRPSGYTQDPIDAPKIFSKIHADIIICVHNALGDVRNCLSSVVRNSDSRHKVILVDDGSDTPTQTYLQEFSNALKNCELIRNENPLGYTKAANQGMRRSTSRYVVLLNSDTIVTTNWIEKIIQSGESDPQIGVISPLSNAASWQSVPERFNRASGDWATNPLPDGWTPEDIARIIDVVSERKFPIVPFLNGFCYAIKRSVIDDIGYFDEESFPDGFAEENDYSLRVADAGFSLAIADHTYIYHAKSKSYTDERRLSLSKKNMQILRQKHGGERIDNGVEILRDNKVLEKIRFQLKNEIKRAITNGQIRQKIRLLFLLPVPGGAGGAHSVVVEAAEMRKLGVDAQIATELRFLTRYRSDYPGLEDIHDLFFFYSSFEELAEYASKFDIIVGTIFHSMYEVEKIVNFYPNVQAAYYIQDYEPWFFAKGTKNYTLAKRSYSLIPRAMLFAKTDWLCDLVSEIHNVTVDKVSPSIDHSVFYPAVKEMREPWPVKVFSMIRPKTTYRGGSMTMSILKKIKEKFGVKVDIHLFGCSDEEIIQNDLIDDFKFLNHGILKREQVGALCREMDIFIDLSEWQAFGRTGLESMACGCAVIIPANGGVGEYAEDRANCLIVDTTNQSECQKAIESLIQEHELRSKLRVNAVDTAAKFTVHRAALSELNLLLDRIGIIEN